jgi:site-specific recombinase XerD
MKLDELLHRFQGDLQIRNYSARTVTDYGYSLGLLFQFLDQRQITDIQSVTSATLADFQRWVYYQPTKQGTPRGVLNQNGILAAVKSFFRFLKVEGYLAADPAEGIEYAREPRSLPRNVLTPQEAKRIISANGNQQQGGCHLFDLVPEAASWGSRPCNAAGAPSRVFIRTFQRQGHPHPALSRSTSGRAQAL